MHIMNLEMDEINRHVACRQYNKEWGWGLLPFLLPFFFCSKIRVFGLKIRYTS